MMPFTSATTNSTGFSIGHLGLKFKVIRALEAHLRLLQVCVNATTPSAVCLAERLVDTTDDWVTVIAPDQQAIHLGTNGNEEVHVMTMRYTPQGLMYQLVSPRPDVTWMVKASSIMPIHGVTEFLETNLITGETRLAP
jgi:hypothetical protein